MRYFGTLLLTIFVIFILGCADDNPSAASDPCDSNQKPVLNEIPDTTITVNDTLWLQLEGNDLDNIELEYTGLCINVSLSDIRSGDVPRSVCEQQTGIFWFFAHNYDMPYRIFRFTVFDTCGAADSIEVVVDVIE